MKYIAIILGIIIIIGLGILFTINGSPFVADQEEPTIDDTVALPDTPIPVEPDGGIGDGGQALEATRQPIEAIGTSVDGTNIMAYHFGEGDTEILLIGGTHGGYSFNTAALGYDLIEYFDANPNAVPDELTVTIIPVLNPDGLKEVVGTSGRFNVSTVTTNDEDRVAGRFNGNTVDINRNFDCQWSTTGTWQDRSVSGGSEPFSEPESRAVRDYVESNGVDAAIVYFSQAGGVYSSTCNGSIAPLTAELTNVYATAAGYPAFEEFDYYEITGDMVNWMAKVGVPAISVLLSTHEDVELSKNQAGVMAVLNKLAE